jgi:hypothetical protein
MAKEDNYFIPPHGGRPPSDAAIKAATERYVQEGAKSTQAKAKAKKAKK